MIKKIKVVLAKICFEMGIRMGSGILNGVPLGHIVMHRRMTPSQSLKRGGVPSPSEGGFTVAPRNRGRPAKGSSFLKD